MSCANTEGIFRIIQSIPSPKARKGGKITGDAREKLEIETGEKVSSRENYLAEPEKKKRLKRPLT